MQSARFACLLLITSATHLLASDKETPPTTVGKKCSDDSVATATLSQSPKSRDLLTPGKPYNLTALQRALIIPTSHDLPQAPANPHSHTNSELRKPEIWYLESPSSNEEPWCPHHDRSETCYRCAWSYRCSY